MNISKKKLYYEVQKNANPKNVVGDVRLQNVVKRGF